MDVDVLFLEDGPENVHSVWWHLEGGGHTKHLRLQQELKLRSNTSTMPCNKWTTGVSGMQNKNICWLSYFEHIMRQNLYHIHTHMPISALYCFTFYKAHFINELNVITLICYILITPYPLPQNNPQLCPSRHLETNSVYTRRVQKPGWF